MIAGKYPAGKYHRLAAERHLRDRTREGTRGFPYVFSLDHAERFFRFAENLRHYKGEWAGTFIRLENHQKFRLGSLFAWHHRHTALRRFRTSYDEIPRKNGKSRAEYARAGSSSLRSISALSSYQPAQFSHTIA